MVFKRFQRQRPAETPTITPNAVGPLPSSITSTHHPLNSVESSSGWSVLGGCFVVGTGMLGNLYLIHEGYAPADARTITLGMEAPLAAIALPASAIGAATRSVLRGIGFVLTRMGGGQ